MEQSYPDPPCAVGSVEHAEEAGAAERSPEPVVAGVETNWRR